MIAALVVGLVGSFGVGIASWWLLSGGLRRMIATFALDPNSPADRAHYQAITGVPLPTPPDPDIVPQSVRGNLPRNRSRAMAR